MTLKSDTKFEEKLICCFKNDKNLVRGSFCSKYITFNLKNYEGVILHDTDK